MSLCFCNQGKKCYFTRHETKTFGVIWRARLHFKKVDALLRLRIVALLRRVQTIELCLLSEAYERKLKEKEKEKKKTRKILFLRCTTKETQT